MELRGGSNLSKAFANSLYVGGEGQYTSLVPSSDGKIDFATNGSAIYRDNGSVLHPYGPIFPLQHPNPQSATTISGTNAFATLTSTINNSVTTITVSNPSTYKAGDTVLIDSEQILIGAISGSDFTGCTRGYNSTSAASHTSATQVYYYAPGATNTLVYVASTNTFPFPATYSYVIQVDSEQMRVTGGGSISFSVTRGVNGTSAAAHANGAAVTIINWTWLNQASGATVTSTTGGDFLTCTSGNGSSHQVIGRISSAAPSTPYHFISKQLNLFPAATYFNTGMFFRESSTGKILTWTLQNASTVGTTGLLSLFALKFTSATAFSAVAYSADATFLLNCFLRIGNNGTNLTFDVSMDGQNFLQLYTEAKTASFTSGPDQVGWYISNFSQIGGSTLIHWLQTS